MIETYVSSNDGFIESPGHFPSAPPQSPRSDVGTGRCFLLLPGRGEGLEAAKEARKHQFCFHMVYPIMD